MAICTECGTVHGDITDTASMAWCPECDAFFKSLGPEFCMRREFDAHCTCPACRERAAAEDRYWDEQAEIAKAECDADCEAHMAAVEAGEERALAGPEWVWEPYDANAPAPF